MDNPTSPGDEQPRLDSNAKRLFWASFIALVATAFGFIVRTQVINEWGV